MLDVVINVKGRTLSDVEQAIDEARRLILDGFTSDNNKDESGSYDFDVSGAVGDYPVETSAGDTLFLTKGEVAAMVEAYNEQSGEEPVELDDELKDEDSENATRQKVYDWAMANKPDLVEAI